MRYREILDEKLLMSEYTFGFELEAIYQYKKNNDDSVYFDSDDWDYGDILPNIFDKYGLKDGKMQYDVSINDYDLTFDVGPDGHPLISGSEMPFEWASPVLQFTPENVKKSLNLITNLKNEKIRTNSSCGFHVHISSPKLSLRDRIWIYLQLCSKKEYIEKLVKFRSYKFQDSEFANADVLFMINKAIKNNKLDVIFDHVTDDKFRVLRLHPIGTLEWRGPRNFISSKQEKIIKAFFIRLYELISLINNLSDNTTLGSWSKEEVLNSINYESHIDQDNIKIIKKLKDLQSDGTKGNIIKKILMDAKINLKDLSFLNLNYLHDMYVKYGLLDQFIQMIKNNSKYINRYYILWLLGEAIRSFIYDNLNVTNYEQYINFLFSLVLSKNYTSFELETTIGEDYLTQLTDKKYRNKFPKASELLKIMKQ